MAQTVSRLVARLLESYSPRLALASGPFSPRSPISACRSLSLAGLPQANPHQQSKGAEETVSSSPVASGTLESEGEKKRVDGAKGADDDDDGGVFVNKQTGEIGGPRGPEPTRYGDWERGGRCSDF